MKFYSNPRWWLTVVPFLILFAIQLIILAALLSLELIQKFAKFAFKKIVAMSKCNNGVMGAITVYVWEKK